MNDGILRIERVKSTIRECFGVFDAYELNFAEVAYACYCIGESVKVSISEKAMEAASAAEESEVPA